MTYSDLKGSETLFEYDEDNIEISENFSHKSLGFNELFKSILRRWDILLKKKLLRNREKSQDLNWIERSIIDEFGQKGREQIKELIKYSSNPFKTLYELRKHLVKD